MTIDDAAKNAIARIEADARRGTGFLVSQEGHVLTAAHVVVSEDDPQRPPTSLIAAFPGGFSSSADCVFVDPRRDWALLKLKDAGWPPALPVRTASSGDVRQKAVSTYGYPSGQPLPLDATVTYWGLAEGEIASAKLVGQPVEGLSGAPVLLDGEAIAVVQRSDLGTNKKSIAGRLFALNLNEVFARLPKLFAGENTELAYQRAVTAKLPEAGRNCYEALLPEDVPTLAGDDLSPRRLARALLLADLPVVKRVLGLLGVRGEPAKAILVWHVVRAVPPAAAAQLHAHTTARICRAVRLRAELDAVPWYLLRSREAERDPPDIVRNRTFAPSLPSDVEPEEVLAHIKRHVRAEGGPDSYLEPKETWSPSDWFFLVLASCPDDEVLEAIRDGLPGAVVVTTHTTPLVTPPSLGDSYFDVIPTLSPADERALLKALDTASKELR